LIKNAGDGYVLSFYLRDQRSNDIAIARSGKFYVSIGNAYQLSFSTFPGTATGGLPFTPFTVIAVTDRGLNVITSVNGHYVNATVGPNAAGAVAMPPSMRQVAIERGYATFSALYIQITGVYSLSFNTDLVYIIILCNIRLQLLTFPVASLGSEWAI